VRLRFNPLEPRFRLRLLIRHCDITTPHLLQLRPLNRPLPIQHNPPSRSTYNPCNSAGISSLALHLNFNAIIFRSRRRSRRRPRFCFFASLRSSAANNSFRRAHSSTAFSQNSLPPKSHCAPLHHTASHCDFSQKNLLTDFRLPSKRFVIRLRPCSHIQHAA
jgi:hypothetical protein